MSKLSKKTILSCINDSDLSINVVPISVALTKEYSHKLGVDFLKLREQAGYMIVYRRNGLKARKEQRRYSMWAKRAENEFMHDLKNWNITRHSFRHWRKQFIKDLELAEKRK